MMERDTLTLLTVGNIESKSVEELERRKIRLNLWLGYIKTELEFVDYIISEKLKREKK